MDVGSENLCLVIKFDSPLEQGWKLKEGHGQVQFLACEDSEYGTRIEAEQDFCMEYRVGVLQQKCKAIGFFVRSESDFAFYARIRVHNQSGEVLPDLMTLYCHPGEGSYPEQHPQYPNECEVHVPVKQLKTEILHSPFLPQKFISAPTSTGERFGSLLCPLGAQFGAL